MTSHKSQVRRRSRGRPTNGRREKGGEGIYIYIFFCFVSGFGISSCQSSAREKTFLRTSSSSQISHVQILSTIVFRLENGDTGAFRQVALRNDAGRGPPVHLRPLSDDSAWEFICSRLAIIDEKGTSERFAAAAGKSPQKKVLVCF